MTGVEIHPETGNARTLSIVCLGIYREYLGGPNWMAPLAEGNVVVEDGADD